MRPIGYADHIRVYHILHDTDDYIFFRFCKGKLRKSKIKYDQDGEAYFEVSGILKFFMNEIMRAQ